MEWPAVPAAPNVSTNVGSTGSVVHPLRLPTAHGHFGLERTVARAQAYPDPPYSYLLQYVYCANLLAIYQRRYLSRK